ncbi:unnamed protein product [Rhodiola kirilowii]
MKVVWGSFGSSDAIFKDVDMPLPYEMVHVWPLVMVCSPQLYQMGGGNVRTKFMRSIIFSR